MVRTRGLAMGPTRYDEWQTRLDTGISDGKIVKTLKRTKTRVNHLCQLYPQCTGNYNLLILRYQWYYHGKPMGIDWKHFQEFKRIPSSETITRAFRKLVEDGELEPTGKILARREQRERAIREKINDI